MIEWIRLRWHKFKRYCTKQRGYYYISSVIKWSIGIIKALVILFCASIVFCPIVLVGVYGQSILPVLCWILLSIGLLLILTWTILVLINSYITRLIEDEYLFQDKLERLGYKPEDL